MSEVKPKGINPEYLKPVNEDVFDPEIGMTKRELMDLDMDKLDEKQRLNDEYYVLAKERLELDSQLHGLQLEENKKNMSHVSNGLALAINVGIGILTVVSSVLLLAKSDEK